MSVVLLSEDEEVSGHVRRPCVGQGRYKVSFAGPDLRGWRAGPRESGPCSTAMPPPAW
jgi:hypothetical protein